MRTRVAPVQVDETRARETRSEVVAAGADTLEKPAPAVTRLRAELRAGICPIQSVCITHGGFLLAWVTFRAPLPAMA